MIVKELDKFAGEDIMSKAGRTVEEQMAFYLRRAFGDDSAVLIINGLRLKKDNDAAQIDHLILHRYGLIVVESKSVTSRIQVNTHGEWIRWVNDVPRGMPSPVQQARRQGEFLNNYLRPHFEPALGRFTGFQTRFSKMTVDVLVAISDNGIVERPEGVALEDVWKADQIPDRIRATVEKYRKTYSLFNGNLLDAGYALNQDELSEIGRFLLQNHRPKQSVRSAAPRRPSAQTLPPAPLPMAPTEEDPVCHHCNSRHLTVEYGRYGYYFRCQDCREATRIFCPCPTCGAKARIHKSGSQFYAECENCHTSRLIFTNKVAA